MIDTSNPTIRPSHPAMPLCLIFSSRLLLTEKSSVENDNYSIPVRTVTFTIRGTVAAPIREEIRGHRHGGIND
jgi:hypothetical protein